MERKVLRMYTGADGETHFEDAVIPMVEDRNLRARSEKREADGVLFQETSSNYEYDWHPAPRRQFHITLEGEGEMEIGDGTKRRLKAGDVMLAEDTTGRGHISRKLSKGSWKVVIITLE
ncbi:hypothetical protein ACFLV1_02745 [Chloroflexota bacterium]